MKQQEILFVDPLGEQRRMTNQIRKNWKYVANLTNEIKNSTMCVAPMQITNTLQDIGKTSLFGKYSPSHTYLNKIIIHVVYL